MCRAGFEPARFIDGGRGRGCAGDGCEREPARGEEDGAAPLCCSSSPDLGPPAVMVENLEDEACTKHGERQANAYPEAGKQQ